MYPRFCSSKRASLTLPDASTASTSCRSTWVCADAANGAAIMATKKMATDVTSRTTEQQRTLATEDPLTAWTVSA